VTAISTSNPYQLDDCEIEIVFCGGNAGPNDTHLASIIHCVDEQIITWPQRRERRRRKRDFAMWTAASVARLTQLRTLDYLERLEAVG
jgi:hypothetical protein